MKKDPKKIAVLIPCYNESKTIEKVVKILPQISTAIMGIVLITFVILVLSPIMEVYMGSFLFDAYL